MSDGPVLIGYDGSEGATAAIATAAELLGPRKALVAYSWTGLSRLLLRSDLRGWTGPLAEAADDIDAEDLAEATRLAARGVELAREAGFDASPLVVKEHDKTWRAICEAAEEHEAGVIVVGARGASALDRLLLGSVSSAVVTHSPAPVLVVPASAPRESAGPVVFCNDGSESARHAVEAGTRLLAGRPAVAVGVFRSWSAHVPVYVPIVSAEAMTMARELDEAAAASAAELAEESSESVKSRGMDCRGLSVQSEGPIWESLLDVADRENAACVVVGSRGRSGVSAALGSVSHGVVHHNARPTLVVPPA
jgi:nucleotide-binding universal stress UspA family protein